MARHPTCRCLMPDRLDQVTGGLGAHQSKTEIQSKRLGHVVDFLLLVFVGCCLLVVVVVVVVVACFSKILC